MGLWPRPALYFYSRPPRGGRLERPDVLLVAFLISIHALREEGDIGRNPGYGIEDISIHALREEGDLPGVRRWSGRQKISIHALREEGDWPQRQARPGTG